MGRGASGQPARDVSTSPCPSRREHTRNGEAPAALIYIFLPIAALLTSILSGMLGMGGGMLLLAALFSCGMPHAEVIPAHAAVQLVSNSTRTLAFWRQVDWRTVRRFLLGVLPGSVLGILVMVVLGRPEGSQPILKIIIGVYILTMAALPTRRDARVRPFTWWDFPLLGLVAGTAAFTVGAIGPLISPLFARRDFVKERLIATKAVCQVLLHLAKIPVFLALLTFDDLAALGLVTMIMAIVVVPGTLIGKRFLRRLSARGFVSLYRTALLVAGAKVLLLDGVWAALRAT